MSALVVVENVRRWRLALPGAEVVPARDYLMDPRYVAMRGAKVFNLCRTYGYQTLGYYVSLLAAARGHRPLPSIETLQDLRSASIVRILSEDLERLIHRSLAGLLSDRFVLSVYFGRNVARRYDPLSQALFNQFPAPLLRAQFVRDPKAARNREGRWRLEGIRAIAASEMPDAHVPFAREQARRYFENARPRSRPREWRYELAILRDPDEVDAPSDERAIRRFVQAAHRQAMDAEIIGREDYGRVAEYDALFIRETTQVHHHTYRFARRAAAEGMVVIDDPESILRCTNKVFLAEAFARKRIPCPRTMIVDEHNAAEAEQVGLPCVVKRPDSSFSRGVMKADTREELDRCLDAVFEDSELAVVQEYAPSSFDWRVGVLDGRALYVCRYHMVPGQWRIQTTDPAGRLRYGRVEALPVHHAPREAVELALRSAAVIGDGLYGVDVKEADGRLLVMEVNENPSIDAGMEDAILGDALYDAVMRYFRDRLDRRGAAGPRR